MLSIETFEPGQRLSPFPRDRLGPSGLWIDVVAAIASTHQNWQPLQSKRLLFEVPQQNRCLHELARIQRPLRTPRSCSQVQQILNSRKPAEPAKPMTGARSILDQYDR